MTNAELISMVRSIAKHGADWRINEVLNRAADALEAINKTVIPHRNYERCHIYWCDCGWFLRNKDQTPNYCPNCGKRIEWENAE